MRKEIEAPWAGLGTRPADTPVFHVARAPAAAQGTVYPTLAAAAAAVSGDTLSVLEIDHAQKVDVDGEIARQNGGRPGQADRHASLWG